MDAERDSYERDSYEVLQVRETAHQEVVHAAFRALARLYHPDGPTPDSGLMAELNRAFDDLKTPERRAEYDRTHEDMVAVGPGYMSEAAEYAPPTETASLGPLARRRAMANGADETPMLDFGTYAGWRLGEVAVHDPGYLRWLLRQTSAQRMRAAIDRALATADEGHQGAGVR